MNDQNFTKTDIKWTANLKRKAVKIALEAERTAVRLDAGIEKKFGTGEAFDTKGQPVCAFGCVLAAAKCVPPSIEKCQKLTLAEIEKLIDDDNEEAEYFAIIGNREALAETLDVSVTYGSNLAEACDGVQEANDSTKSGWERRRGKIAKALRAFSTALLTDAGLL